MYPHSTWYANMGSGSDGSGDAARATTSSLMCGAWMAVYRPSDKKWGVGKTGEFALPRVVVDLVNGGMELGDADDAVFKVQPVCCASHAATNLTHHVSALTEN